MRSIHPLAGPLDLRRSAYLISCGVFLLVLATCGGASKAGEFAQTIVRTGSLAMIAIALLQRSRPFQIGNDRFAFVFLGAITTLIGLQLIPLPPSLWLEIPGHEFYRGAATAIQIAQPWRPINLVPDQGWDSLLTMLPVWATLVATSTLRLEERRFTVGAVVLIAVLSASLGMVQMVLGQDSPLYYYNASSVGTPSGFFANRNHQAIMLAAGMVASSQWGAWALRSRPASTGLRVGLALSAFTALLLVLVATGSRAGLVLGAVATLASIYFWRNGVIASGLGVGNRISRILIPAAALAVATIALVALLFNRGQSFDRLLSMGTEDQTRTGALQPLWLMLKTFFPFGSGVGSFDPVYRRFERLDDLEVEYLNQAHNDLIQVVIEAGLLGGLLVVIYLCWWAYRTFMIWRSPDERADQLTARLGTIIVAMLLLLSLTDYPLRTPSLASLGILASVWMLPRRDKSDHVGTEAR